MNTDKTLKAKFIEKKDYPIWYYNELRETTVDYVIWNLLLESFVVEVDGSKYELTFGKNRKNEIGSNTRYDDIVHTQVTCVIDKGFREGKWYTITDVATTDEFKANYVKTKEAHVREEIRRWNMHVLTTIIKGDSSLSDDQKSVYLKQVADYTYEDLESAVFSKLKNFF